MPKQKVLLILEDGVLENASLAYSNDINLLLSLLKHSDTDTYITSPRELILAKKNNTQITCRHIIIKNKRDLNYIEEARKKGYFTAAIKSLCCLPLRYDLKKSTTIPRKAPNITEEKLPLYFFNIVHDRTEPISHTPEYYKVAKDFSSNSKKHNDSLSYYDDLDIRSTKSDKEIVYDIDQELQKKNLNKLGFSTEILDFESEDLSLRPKTRKIFYKILQTLPEYSEEKTQEIVIQSIKNAGIELSNREESALTNIISKCFKSNRNFQYSCIKPARWYGGIGVELVGNKNKKIKEKFTPIILMKNIGKIHQAIIEDAFDTFKNEQKALENAILPALAIQEQAKYPKFGDLRIFISFGKIQGIIVRVPTQNSNISNMHSGGHPELFIDVIGKSKEELNILRNELKELGAKYEERIDATLSMIERVYNSFKTQVGQHIEKSAYIGYDALLTENHNTKTYLACNEINLSGAMGQNQIEISKLLEKMLEIESLRNIICNTITPYLPDSSHSKTMMSKFNNFKTPYAKFCAYKEAITTLSLNTAEEISQKLIIQITSSHDQLPNEAQEFINKQLEDIIGIGLSDQTINISIEKAKKHSDHPTD